MPDYIGDIEIPEVPLRPSKICSQCGLAKNRSEFSKNSQQRDGLRPDCKECQRKHQREYYLRTRRLKGRYGVPAMDLTGNRFGRLIVVNRVHNDKQGKAQWLCSCDCGGTIVVRRGCLRNGNTKSCGCLAREAARMIVQTMRRKCGQEYPPGEAARRDVLQEYKRAAKVRKYEWQLTDEQAIKLMTSSCHYCGKKPSTKRSISSNGSFIYNGLDRKDNAQGYRIDNVVSCCPICNRAKMDMPHSEFIAWAKRIAEVHN